MNILHIPGSIVSECLAHLVETKLVSHVLDRSSKRPILRYQPAKPLEHMTLGSVKETLETHVGKVSLELVMDSDPALTSYDKAIRQFMDLPEAKQTLDALLQKP
jgi:hypothetical protein